MQTDEPSENLDLLCQDEDAYFVVITGGFSSGKSTFLRTINDNHIWLKTDENFDIESTKIVSDEDLRLYLVAPPNTRRWNKMWDIIASQRLLSFITIVDTSVASSFREANNLIETFKAFSTVPFVVAANKQDQPKALPPEDLRLALDIPPEIPVVPCVATDKESVKRVLVALLDEVLKARAQDRRNV